MTFEEFLEYVRKEIGNYCTDEYWQWEYSMLVDKSVEGIKKEIPFMAVRAVGADYGSKHSGKRQ